MKFHSCPSAPVATSNLFKLEMHIQRKFLTDAGSITIPIMGGDKSSIALVRDRGAA